MNILEWPHEALSTKCEPVEDFGTELHQQLDDMWKAMEAVTEMDAMALAANQVGLFKRVFIMKCLNGERLDVVNPVWEAETDGGYAHEDEGCLSTPGIWGVVLGRSQVVLVSAQDRNGEPLKLMCEGLEAVCIQHEVDHLDGVFWWDKMHRNPRRALEREWKKKRGRV